MTTSPSVGTPEPVVAVSGLSHQFGSGALRRQVLHEIETEIQSGEIVIVTGPSGSGKTTLLSLMGGLRAPQGGSVRVLGRELVGCSEAERIRVRRQIGYIFQGHNLLGSLSSKRNVMMSLRGQPGLSRAEGASRATRALAAVGLGDKVDRFPDQLSGGERQRVAVARALARQPRLILADEPTASLDKSSGRAVVDLLNALARQQGCAVLMVTHDNRILDVADRLIHIEDGRLTSFGREVASSTRRMLDAFVRNNRHGELLRQVRDLSFAGFTRFLEGVTAEFQQFLGALDMSEDEAFESMLEQVLEAFTLKAAELLRADRATLFLVDREKGELVSKIAHGQGELRVPIGVGIAGHVARSGRPMNVADAYAEPLFHQEVDRQTGYRTRSLLCLPLQDSKGAVFAVIQLLNKADGGRFDADDERSFHETVAAIGLTLEVWCRTRPSGRAAASA